MIASFLFAALVGIAQGLRHAFEPDHLAAVSTMVVGPQSSQRRVAFAATWGFGHALMLLFVGGVLAVVRMELPVRISDAFEAVVGVVLIGLGVRSISLARSLNAAHSHADPGSAAQAHRHGVTEHSHPSQGRHVHVLRQTFSARPLLVGLTHGLAGSGALAAIVIARTESTAWALSFIALYGAGATLGMSLMAALISLPLTHVAQKPLALRATVFASGLVSAATGFFWLIPIIAKAMT